MILRHFGVLLVRPDFREGVEYIYVRVFELHIIVVACKRMLGTQYLAPASVPHTNSHINFATIRFCRACSRFKMISDTCETLVLSQILLFRSEHGRKGCFEPGTRKQQQFELRAASQRTLKQVQGHTAH